MLFDVTLVLGVKLGEGLDVGEYAGPLLRLGDVVPDELLVNSTDAVGEVRRITDAVGLMETVSFPQTVAMCGVQEKSANSSQETQVCLSSFLTASAQRPWLISCSGQGMGHSPHGTTVKTTF